MSTNVQPPAPSRDASDWERHTHQDKELVKGLGLTSATMLVMGSMIGSGIFIVSAEISREVASPALLIGAWLITGFLTIVGALTLRRTGGYDAACRRTVRLSARVARPALGLSLRLDSVSRDSDGHDRRRGRGFRQVPRNLLAGNFFQPLDRPPLESSEVRRRPR